MRLSSEVAICCNSLHRSRQSPKRTEPSKRQSFFRCSSKSASPWPKLVAHRFSSNPNLTTTALSAPASCLLQRPLYESGATQVPFGRACQPCTPEQLIQYCQLSMPAQVSAPVDSQHTRDRNQLLEQEKLQEQLQKPGKQACLQISARKVTCGTQVKS